MAKMTKTSDSKCMSCLYGGSKNGCSYLLLTGERRGCEIGLCDKYEKSTSRDRLAYHREVYNKSHQIPKKEA